MLKLWQAGDAFDPEAPLAKFDDASAFDWDDLRQLVRRTQMIEPNLIVADCLKGFAFLTERNPAEAELAADPHQRDHALWTMLRDDLPVGSN